ncbi:homoserine dehydrogenase [Terribacillus sp. 179-K 1B1 HS]|uniref:homoserine dehydrogenase n=1 Tax=Terribacillus sp. 179-K 1B1 HS TaxID=3142388 RepID=UPI00399FDD7E
MKQKIQIGLCGLGTVGSGVVQILQEHQEQIRYRLGCEVEVAKVLVKNKDKKREYMADGSILTTDPAAITDNPAIDIVVEVMGGLEDTYQLLERSIRNRKQIVTANKDLMAEHGDKLFALSQEYDTDIYYEASVAGGIPILRSLSDGLASDKIQKVMGIVNGTTNFILTKMTDEKRSFEKVLKEAQELGFAEADPTSDVEGLDAARKMTLLANLAFKMPVAYGDVDVAGITSISREDIEFAGKLGYIVKLIGIAAMDEGKVEVSVEPTLLPEAHPLAQVKNEFNAVYVYGQAVGETMFYGPGAGGLPTATAVVSDLMEVVKNIRLGVSGKAYVQPQYKTALKDDTEKHAKHFIRVEAEDQTGAFHAVTNVFAEQDVSFAKILQLPHPSSKTAEVVMVTHKHSKRQIENSIQQLEQLDVVKRVISCYRVDGED